MSLQFILGGPGRGKTYYVQHMAASGAFKNPGKEYIIIVPEQFTMQTQKELVELSPSKGIMNIDVQSFLRLAFRVFTELGAGNEPVLDDMGKTMILKKVLIDKQDELGYFGRNIHKKGYITEIKSFLSELVQYGVNDEMLGRMIGSAEKKPVLKRKLEDMSIAYKAFLDYINNNYNDMLLKLVNASFYREIKSKISARAAKALYNEVFRGSTSQLERYAACAFSYFVQYGLRLEERAEHKVEFFDIGNIVHDALKLYTDKLLKDGKQWWELTEKEQQAQADKCLEEAVAKYKNSLMYETERDTYMVTRLRKLLTRTVWAITEQMKLGKFDTVESEFKFDVTEDNGGAGDNQKDTIHLIGRIDRIDEYKDDKCTYIKIVDYKTGKKEMSLSDLYYGLQMQLVIYLKAAMEAAEETKIVIPAGVLYYNIANPVIEGKPDKDEIGNEMLKSLKMRGIVNEDDPVLPLLDSNFDSGTGRLPAAVSSVVAPFSTDKNGKLKKASQAITTKDFDRIISYTQKNIVDMGNEIMEGRTEASPYKKNDAEGKTACDYCGYKGICRFDARIPGNKYRVLDKLSDDDVLAKIYQQENNK